jgi:hypothetical protein
MAEHPLEGLIWAHGLLVHSSRTQARVSMARAARRRRSGMTTLQEHLSKILPEVLPRNPAEAINGTEVFNRVHSKIPEYAEASIRQHLSQMSANSDSVIAKVEKGHGYYLRAGPGVNGESLGGSASAEETLAECGETGGRDSQPEEKFRALYMRLVGQENRFPMLIEHTRGGKQHAGVDKWKYPDVVVLDWEVGRLEDTGYRLDSNLLDVKRSLGEQSFRLTSVELKTRLTLANFRECFFQCVSNSKWAHHAVLAVAEEITDELLATELRRLGSSYDVSVISYSFAAGFLDSVPPASKIAEMGVEDFDSLAGKTNLARIAPGRPRGSLDWEHIRDMQGRTEDFVSLFRWISRCLQERRPYIFEHFKSIADICGKY